jgi:hypothetical protein
MIGAEGLTMIIPGVQVEVLRELVPPLPAPSGIMGIAGVTQIQPARLTPVASFNEFKDVFGAASSFSISEVRQAFENGIAEVVVAPVGGGSAGTHALDDSANAVVATLTARANGPWSQRISVTVAAKTGAVDITVTCDDVTETFRNLAANRVVSTISSGSVLVDAAAGASSNLPAAGTFSLSAGDHPATGDYTAAIDTLELDPSIDLVLASIQNFAATGFNADAVHSAIEAHCRTMSDTAKNRIGFGTVDPANDANPAAIVAKAGLISSERFVLVAPSGVLGSVIGLIGGLDYFRSPTFKTLSGLTQLNHDYTPSELGTLIQGGVLAVALQRNRGFVVIKGIDTTGQTGQISVTRVVDHAVRGVKDLADLFIGSLNTDAGRSALRQKLIEFFLEMERDTAIVPSVDGKDPSFKVDVYSTQRDFALGIVRVDIAVRPVRAIDFIFATILVEV